MFESKAKIKVLIIGTDGISRKYWVEHDAEFYDKRYKIDQDAIYQSEEKGWMGSKVVPTIMFRANNVMPISYKVKPSIPDPDEMGMSISRAAWAIAELMRRKEDAFKSLITILLVAACILGGAATFMGYDNGVKIKALEDKVNQSIVQPSPNINPTLPSQLIPIAPTPVQPTPTLQQIVVT